MSTNHSGTKSIKATGIGLVYLDQSFLSELCLTTESSASAPILDRLFSKLQLLKATNRIFPVISDIHCRETSAINEEHAKNRKKLWRFENALADGKIAADWADVFIAQHRRMLVDEGSDSYPVADIRLKYPHRYQVGINVVLTNSWRLRMHRANTPTSDEINNRFREIIDRQVENIPHCQEVADCLNYIRGLWRKDIRQGITAWQQRRDFILSFEQLGNSPDAEQLTSLQIPQLPVTPFLRIIDEVTRGLDELVVLKRWSEILKNDPIGSCPSLRIRTALEAELLWTRYKGARLNPKKFNKSFGLSRQNDIDHVSAFVPYVDALTTDKDMHSLCVRKTVHDELKPFPCKIFSKKNYDKFEEWLDELLAESKIRTSLPSHA